MPNKVYELVADKIIAELENGSVPWQKPWHASGGMPRNLSTGKAYRGINVLLLHGDYESAWWVTYKQAQKLGAYVREDEKGTPVIFWKRYETTDRKTGDLVTIPVLRKYTVFNTAQVEGLDSEKFPQLKPAPTQRLDPIKGAVDIWDSWNSKPAIRHGHSGACYVPSLDQIRMPAFDTFRSAPEYYSTLFHEATHATGHVSRLGRDLVGISAMDSERYSKEELIAEMGSAFLCSHAGISSERLIENQAAYLRHWIRSLKANREWIVSAAAAAQRAADNVLNVKWSD